MLEPGFEEPSECDEQAEDDDKEEGNEDEDEEEGNEGEDEDESNDKSGAVAVGRDSSSDWAGRNVEVSTEALEEMSIGVVDTCVAVGRRESKDIGEEIAC